MTRNARRRPEVSQFDKPRNRKHGRPRDALKNHSRMMAFLKDKRQTEEQVATFAKKATQQNEFHCSRRDPCQEFRRDPYQKVMGMAPPASRREVVIRRHAGVGLTRSNPTNAASLSGPWHNQTAPSQPRYRADR